MDTEGLEEEQLEATEFIRKNPICCLVGPPGTGKTTVAMKATKSFDDAGFSQYAMCPTGKAAKRVEEVLSKWIPGHEIPVSTIHRALAPIPEGAGVGVPDEHAKFNRGRDRFTFTRNEENPLESEVIIMDESSMTDVSLSVDLLRAVQDGTRILFVGDENQLPSVGPGAVLRDLIEGGIPTFHLTKPRRNSGRIVKACHSIYHGEMPYPSDDFDPSIGENWLHIEESNPSEIAKIIVDIHDNTTRDKMRDLQVISPQNDSNLPIGCENLNQLLSRKLNPLREKWAGRNEDRIKGKFGPGDKIVRRKNGFVKLMTPVKDDIFSLESDSSEADFVWRDELYFLNDTYVVNGDIGFILDMDEGKNGYIIVQFSNPDRLCKLPIVDSHLQLAYAMTCHLAQGSGFPVVIFPLHDSFYWNDRDKSGLWCREMLYTIFSRVIDVGISVGKLSSLKTAIDRKTVHKRKTLLSRFLKGEIK